MIGIYGGTFNPVHYGHLRTALELQNLFAFDQIRFIPCYQPALKNQPNLNATMRLEMLQLAIVDQPKFVCDDQELIRQGRSYTIETLMSLRQQFPQQPLVLLMGSDAFATLPQWHQWQKLLDYAHIIVMLRPESQQPPLLNYFKRRLANNPANLKHNLAGKLYLQTVTQLAISSTKIRALLTKGGTPQFLMPNTVIDYISQHNLYRNLHAN
jgi:nicotinate-nucleotide adenylyltransferase